MYANALAYYDVKDNLRELAGAMAGRSAEAPVRVLVGVDGSASSLGAVEYARDRVKEGGGEVLLVNVQPAPAAPDARVVGERALAAAKRLLEAAGVRHATEVAYGDVAASLLRCAERDRSTLIALGESGRSALAKFILGSISYSVVNEAEVPVALVSRSIRATTYPPRLRRSPFVAA